MASSHKMTITKSRRLGHELFTLLIWIDGRLTITRTHFSEGAARSQYLDLKRKGRI